MRRLLPALLLTAASAACSDIQVISEVDPQADFAGLDSYAWMPPEWGIIDDPAVNLDLLDARVKQAVEEEMASRGYRLAGRPDAADLLARYRVSLATQRVTARTDQGVSFGAEGGWEYDFGVLGGSTRSGSLGERRVEKGTLVLELLDAAGEWVMWRGLAQAEVDVFRPSTEKDARLREAVGKMLAGLPPQ